MFRQHNGFRKIATLARAGTLGDNFMIRAHMSTNLLEENPDNMNISMKG